MTTMKHGTLVVANTITMIAIGIWYAVLLRYFLSVYVPFFVEQPGTAASKMFATGLSSISATFVTFIANYYCTRQNMKGVGTACGTVAFVYFYVFKSWPEVLHSIFLVLLSNYSAFAKLAFIFTPVLAGMLLNRRISLNGLNSVFCAEKDK